MLEKFRRGIPIFLEEIYDLKVSYRTNSLAPVVGEARIGNLIQNAIVCMMRSGKRENSTHKPHQTKTHQHKQHTNNMNCIQLALVALVACALSAPGADAALRGVPVARQLLNARELSGGSCSWYDPTCGPSRRLFA